MSIAPSIEPMQQLSSENVSESNTSSKIATILPVNNVLNKIKLSRPEYYSDPSIEILNEQYEGAILNLEIGLTIGRVGFGSVFWPGPLELGLIDLDEIVYIEQNQVIVYPNELTKPKVGVDLNRTAEVNLDKIWPHGKNKQVIKVIFIYFFNQLCKKILYLGFRRISSFTFQRKIRANVATFGR